MSERGLSLSPVAPSTEPPTSPTPPASRIVSATTFGASPKHFSRSADTGRSTASTIMRAFASDSSRVTLPSRLPSTPALAPLEVASAGKPSAASTRAEPASHGLAITNARGPWCSARKRAALSLWLVVMRSLLVVRSFAREVYRRDHDAGSEGSDRGGDGRGQRAGAGDRAAPGPRGRARGAG